MEVLDERADVRPHLDHAVALACQLLCCGVVDLVTTNADAIDVFAEVASSPLRRVGLQILDHTPVRRLDEAVAVDHAVRRQRADQADVWAFRRLDRADAPIVAVVHVADVEPGAVP